MAKKKSNNEKRIEKEIENTGDITKQTIKYLLAVLIFLGVFYLLTLGFQKLGKRVKPITIEEDIQYEEILAGETFSVNDKEYYVIYYDKNKDDGTYSDLISKYLEKEKHLNVYSVDLDEALNSKYKSESTNYNPKDASEIRVSEDVLFHIKDKKLVKVYSKKDISNVLR